MNIENEPDKKKRKEKYGKLVKQVTPSYSLALHMIQAFLTGGAICAAGQIIMNLCISLGESREEAALWTTLILILSSVILTGLNIYPTLAKFGGAGALVPVTGFANGVAASAIEYKKEGQVFGVGCQIFNIAGPVILYGIFTSWILGFIYWIILRTGLFHLS